MPPEELARQLGRRKALQIIGMAMVAVACGPAETTERTDNRSSTSDATERSDNGSSTGDAGTGRDRSASDPGESPEAGSVPGDSDTDDEQTDRDAGPSEPSSQVPEFDSADALETASTRERVMPAEMVSALTGVYGGVWLGAWSDSNGEEGTVDANVGFNAETSSLDIAVAATGAILGSDGLEPTSVSVPLGGDFFEFEERAPLGYMYVFNQGNETEVISLHHPPAAPDLESLMIELSYAADGSAIATYEALQKDGSTITGSIVLSRGEDRPQTPAL